MKFISFITEHTEESLQSIISGLDKEQLDSQKYIYASFEHVEYILPNGYVGMYAILNNSTLEKLLEEYTNCGVSFKYTDITSDVLLGMNPKIIDVNQQGNLMFMIRRFVRENNTLDNVLDKINKKGIESLSFIDKKILESI